MQRNVKTLQLQLNEAPPAAAALPELQPPSACAHLAQPQLLSAAHLPS
jgi:hypothetical protein